MALVNPRIKWHGTAADASVTSAKAGVVGWLTDELCLIVFRSSTPGDFERQLGARMSELRSDLTEFEKSVITRKLGIYSNFILLSAYVSNMELTGVDAAGWALSGSMVEGQNAVTALPVLTQAYNEGISYGTGTIYATITGLKRAITLKKGLLIAPYSEANVNALNALWDAGKEANVWLLDTVNQRFMCPRTRNWTANTTGVSEFIEEGVPSLYIDTTGTGLNNTMYHKNDEKYSKIARGDGDINYFGSSPERISLSYYNNPTYKNGATVQQNASTVYIYYRIYDGIKPSEDIVVEDLTQILTDVQSLENTKLDKDLSNATPSDTFKNKSVGWVIPDYDSGITVSGTSYTTPVRGYIYGECAQDVGLYVKIGTRTIMRIDTLNYQAQSGFVQVDANVNLSFIRTGSMTVIFYPMKGANNV